MIIQVEKVCPQDGHPKKGLFDKYATDISVNANLSWLFHVVWLTLSGVGIGLLLQTKVNVPALSVPLLIAGLIFSFISGRAFRHTVRMYVHQKHDSVPDSLQAPTYYLIVSCLLAGFLLIADYNGTNQVYRQLFLKEKPDIKENITEYHASMTNLEDWRAKEIKKVDEKYREYVSPIHRRYESLRNAAKGNKAKIAVIDRWERDNKRLRELQDSRDMATEQINGQFVVKAKIVAADRSKLDMATDVQIKQLERDKEAGRWIAFLSACFLLSISTLTLIRQVILETTCGVVYKVKALHRQQTQNPWGLLISQFLHIFTSIPIFLYNIVSSNVQDESVGRQRRLFRKKGMSQSPPLLKQNSQNMSQNRHEMSENGQSNPLQSDLFKREK